jgi:hypothetical protein
MKSANFTAIGLALTAVIGLSATSFVPRADGRTRGDQARAGQYGGSLDAWQHGYEHAYRDGADQGRQDRERKLRYSWRDNDYFGARGYERAFGDRNEYMDGYRQGYQAGYDDGYYGLNGQYGQLYGHSQAGPRVPPANDPYVDRRFGASDMAFDAGYREGITLGQQDRGRNARPNFRGNNVYKNGDLGYRASYGDREAYRLQFRDGLERGYVDGYGRSQYEGVGGNTRGYSANGSAIGGRTNAGGRTIGTAGSSANGTFTVAANRQWTPTGIRVNQGEVLRFQSTGEIRFTGDANDRAGVAGSPAHKFVSGAPLPTALAGALIGRIDNGLPFGIGDQSTITVPASGLLYLGTNDDNVSDNSGQFQVTISFQR